MLKVVLFTGSWSRMGRRKSRLRILFYEKNFPWNTFFSIILYFSKHLFCIPKNKKLFCKHYFILFIRNLIRKTNILCNSRASLVRWPWGFWSSIISAGFFPNLPPKSCRGSPWGICIEYLVIREKSVWNDFFQHQ